MMSLPEYERWRRRARELLIAGVPPGEAFWEDERSGQSELFREEPASYRVSDVDGALRVPKAFVALADEVACHRDERRWGLLYRLLWRLARGGERHLLKIAHDPDVVLARKMAKEVGRDIHKMRAFVRFRKVGESDAGREQFVAWFEPSHRIVRRNADFFRRRFAGMDWSIFTPDECAHWDGETLRFSSGVTRDQAPDEDALDDLWRQYYKSIFNPARLKLKAMQAEMPVKYWKNLPEAPLIRQLTIEASRRRDIMIETSGLEPRPAPTNAYLEKMARRNELRTWSPGEGANRAAEMTFDEMRELAACCRACPLWERATQTVFGVGNPDAAIMIVGEQPGDREDIEGRPFVGPAGDFLDAALCEAGIDRDEIYLTNAVKHFKWKPAPSDQGRGLRGPRRLHDTANRDEFQACRPWLVAEIAKVRPRVIVTLGNTAARSLLGADFQVTRDRGEWRGRNLVETEARFFATVHPSFMLRMRDRAAREIERQRFVEDLAAARVGSRNFSP